MNRNEGKILEVVHDHHLRYEGKTGIFSVLGALSFDLSTLKASVHISSSQTHKQRFKLDLYKYSQIQRICEQLSELHGFNFVELEQDFLQLTSLLEIHREEKYTEAFVQEKVTPKRLALSVEKEIQEKLQSKDLLENITNLLTQAGIQGEEPTKLFLFILSVSYKGTDPIHGLLFGSGASYILNTIADCFPQEDVIKLSRITSKSLFHYKQNIFTDKVIIIQDYDYLDKEVRYALKQLQTHGELTSSVTKKDQYGNPLSKQIGRAHV